MKPMLLNEINVSDDIFMDKEKLVDFVKTNYSNFIYQEKFNGVRALVSVKNNKITAIRDRNNNPIFQNYEELKEVEFPFKECLLDCEIVILDEKGKSHYYNEYDKDKKLIQAGIQMRSMSIKDKSIIKKYLVTLIVFDVLKIDDELLITKPYKERHDRLKINETDRIKVIKNYYDFSEIWNNVVGNELEGVVCKNPNSPYELDTRSKNYLKLKNYKFVDVIIEKTELNEKGIKVFGNSTDNINVEVQVAGVSNLAIGSKIKIKYLEKVGERYTQPTIA